jgi:hypothetical protein
MPAQVPVTYPGLCGLCGGSLLRYATGFRCDRCEFAVTFGDSVYRALCCTGLASGYGLHSSDCTGLSEDDAREMSDVAQAAFRPWAARPACSCGAYAPDRCVCPRVS